MERLGARAVTHNMPVYFFRTTRCVSVEPAAVFVDLLNPGLRNTFDAAVAALVDVTFGGALC